MAANRNDIITMLGEWNPTFCTAGRAWNVVVNWVIAAPLLPVELLGDRIADEQSNPIIVRILLIIL